VKSAIRLPDYLLIPSECTNRGTKHLAMNTEGATCTRDPIVVWSAGSILEDGYVVGHLVIPDRVRLGDMIVDVNNESRNSSGDFTSCS